MNTITMQGRTLFCCIVIINILNSGNCQKIQDVYRDSPTGQQGPNGTATKVKQEEGNSANTQIRTEGAELTTDGLQGQDISLIDAVSVKVWITEEDSISHVDFSQPFLRQPSLIENKGLDVYSIDFHWNKSLAFFATNNSIYRVHFLSNTGNYSLTSIVKNRLEGSVRLAVDWIHDKLYWMCDIHQTIETADLDGQNRRLLIDNIRTFKFPNNIVVDPYERLLFFVSDYALFKANLDGSNIKHVSVEQNTRGSHGWGIRHITLDRKNKIIFLTGKTKSSKYANATLYVVKVGYNGMGDMKNMVKNMTDLSDIYSMEAFNDTLYVANFEEHKLDKIYTISLLDKHAEPKLIYVPRTKENGIWSIRVVHPCVQMVGSCQCQTCVN